MLDVKEKKNLDKQLNSFIEEIEEQFHLDYKDTIWVVIDGILNSPRFQKEFYILKNLMWNEKSAWIGNLKIVQKITQ